MSLDLNEAGKTLLGMVGGAEWPDGEETKMWQLAGYLREAAAQIAELVSDVANAKTIAVAAYPSGTGIEAMTVAFDGFADYLPKLVDQFEQLATQADDAGGSMETGKIQIISSLILLALELAASKFFPLTAPAVDAAAMGATRIALTRVAQWLFSRLAGAGVPKLTARLAVQLAGHALLGGAMGLGQDAGIQLWEIGHGHQSTGFDTTRALSSAAAGAAGGGAGGAFGKGLQKLSTTGWGLDHLTPQRMFAANVLGGGIVGGLAGWAGGAAVTGDWTFDYRMVSSGIIGAGTSMWGHQGFEKMAHRNPDGFFAKFNNRVGPITKLGFALVPAETRGTPSAPTSTPRAVDRAPETPTPRQPAETANQSSATGGRQHEQEASRPEAPMDSVSAVQSGAETGVGTGQLATADPVDAASAAVPGPARAGMDAGRVATSVGPGTGSAENPPQVSEHIAAAHPTEPAGLAGVAGSADDTSTRSQPTEARSPSSETRTSTNDLTSSRPAGLPGTGPADRSGAGAGARIVQPGIARPDFGSAADSSGPAGSAARAGAQPAPSAGRVANVDAAQHHSAVPRQTEDGPAGSGDLRPRRTAAAGPPVSSSPGRGSTSEMVSEVRTGAEAAQHSAGDGRHRGAENAATTTPGYAGRRRLEEESAGGRHRGAEEAATTTPGYAGRRRLEEESAGGRHRGAEEAATTTPGYAGRRRLKEESAGGRHRGAEKAATTTPGYSGKHRNGEPDTVRADSANTSDTPMDAARTFEPRSHRGEEKEATTTLGYEGSRRSDEVMPLVDELRALGIDPVGTEQVLRDAFRALKREGHVGTTYRKWLAQLSTSSFTKTIFGRRVVLDTPEAFTEAYEHAQARALDMRQPAYALMGALNSTIFDTPVDMTVEVLRLNVAAELGIPDPHRLTAGGWRRAVADVERQVHEEGEQWPARRETLSTRELAAALQQYSRRVALFRKLVELVHGVPSTVPVPLLHGWQPVPGEDEEDMDERDDAASADPGDFDPPERGPDGVDEPKSSPQQSESDAQPGSEAGGGHRGPHSRLETPAEEFAQTRGRGRPEVSADSEQHRDSDVRRTEPDDTHQLRAEPEVPSTRPRAPDAPLESDAPRAENRGASDDDRLWPTAQYEHAHKQALVEALERQDVQFFGHLAHAVPSEVLRDVVGAVEVLLKRYPDVPLSSVRFENVNPDVPEGDFSGQASDVRLYPVRPRGWGAEIVLDPRILADPVELRARARVAVEAGDHLPLTGDPVRDLIYRQVAEVLDIQGHRAAWETAQPSLVELYRYLWSHGLTDLSFRAWAGQLSGESFSRSWGRRQLNAEAALSEAFAWVEAHGIDVTRPEYALYRALMSARTGAPWDTAAEVRRLRVAAELGIAEPHRFTAVGWQRELVRLHIQLTEEGVEVRAGQEALGPHAAQVAVGLHLGRVEHYARLVELVYGDPVYADDLPLDGFRDLVGAHADPSLSGVLARNDTETQTLAALRAWFGPDVDVRVPRHVGLDGMSATEFQAAARGQLRAVDSDESIAAQVEGMRPGAAMLVVAEYAGPVDAHGVGAYAYLVVNDNGVAKIRDRRGHLLPFPPREGPHTVQGRYGIAYDHNGTPLHALGEDRIPPVLPGEGPRSRISAEPWQGPGGARDGPVVFTESGEVAQPSRSDQGSIRDSPRLPRQDPDNGVPVAELPADYDHAAAVRAKRELLSDLAQWHGIALDDDARIGFLDPHVPVWVVEDLQQMIDRLRQRFPQVELARIGVREFSDFRYAQTEWVRMPSGQGYGAEITLNAAWVRNPEAWAAAMAADVESGWVLPKTGNPVLDTLAYEFGHALNFSRDGIEAVEVKHVLEVTHRQLRDARLIDMSYRKWVGQLSEHSFERGWKKLLLRPSPYTALPEAFASMTGGGFDPLRPEHALYRLVTGEVGPPRLDEARLLIERNSLAAELGIDHPPTLNRATWDAAIGRIDNELTRLGRDLIHRVDDSGARAELADYAQRASKLDRLRRLVELHRAVRPIINELARSGVRVGEGFFDPEVSVDTISEFARAAMFLRDKFPDVAPPVIAIEPVERARTVGLATRVVLGADRVGTKIVLARRMAVAPEFLAKGKARNVEIGFHQRGTGRPVFDIVVHEFGHVIGLQIERPTVEQAQRILNDAYVGLAAAGLVQTDYDTWVRQLSGYSFVDGDPAKGINWNEAFAEALVYLVVRGRDWGSPHDAVYRAWTGDDTQVDSDKVWRNRLAWELGVRRPADLDREGWDAVLTSLHGEVAAQRESVVRQLYTADWHATRAALADNAARSEKLIQLAGLVDPQRRPATSQQAPAALGIENLLQQQAGGNGWSPEAVFYPAHNRLVIVAADDRHAAALHRLIGSHWAQLEAQAHHGLEVEFLRVVPDETGTRVTLEQGDIVRADPDPGPILAQPLGGADEAVRAEKARFVARWDAAGIAAFGVDHPAVPVEAVRDLHRAIQFLRHRFPDVAMPRFGFDVLANPDPPAQVRRGATGELEVTLDLRSVADPERMTDDHPRRIADGRPHPDTAKPVLDAVIGAFAQVLDQYHGPATRSDIDLALRDTYRQLREGGLIASAYDEWIKQLRGAGYLDGVRDIDPERALAAALKYMLLREPDVTRPEYALYRMLVGDTGPLPLDDLAPLTERVALARELGVDLPWRLNRPAWEDTVARLHDEQAGWDREFVERLNAPADEATRTLWRERLARKTRLARLTDLVRGVVDPSPVEVAEREGAMRSALAALRERGGQQWADTVVYLPVERRLVVLADGTHLQALMSLRMRNPELFAQAALTGCVVDFRQLTNSSASGAGNTDSVDSWLVPASPGAVAKAQLVTELKATGVDAIGFGHPDVPAAVARDLARAITQLAGEFPAGRVRVRIGELPEGSDPDTVTVTRRVRESRWRRPVTEIVFNGRWATDPTGLATVYSARVADGWFLSAGRGAVLESVVRAWGEAVDIRAGTWISPLSDSTRVLPWVLVDTHRQLVEAGLVRMNFDDWTRQMSESSFVEKTGDIDLSAAAAEAFVYVRTRGVDWTRPEYALYRGLVGDRAPMDMAQVARDVERVRLAEKLGVAQPAGLDATGWHGTLDRLRQDIISERRDLLSVSSDTVSPAMIADHLIRVDAVRRLTELVRPGEVPAPQASPVPPQVRDDPAPDGALARARAFADRIDAAIATGEVEVEPLRGGRHRVEKVTYADGTVVVRKQFGDRLVDAHAEYLAALVGMATRAKVPAVVLGEGFVYVEYIEGQTGKQLLRSGFHPFLDVWPYTDTVDGRRLGRLDALVGNLDRRYAHGNWMTDERHLWGIDHEMTYRQDQSNSNFAGRARENIARFGLRWLDPLEPADSVTSLRSELESLRTEFERLDRGDWHAQTIQQLSELERGARDVGRARVDLALELSQARDRVVSVLGEALDAAEYPGAAQRELRRALGSVGHPHDPLSQWLLRPYDTLVELRAAGVPADVLHQVGTALVDHGRVLQQVRRAAEDGASTMKELADREADLIKWRRLLRDQGVQVGLAPSPDNPATLPHLPGDALCDPLTRLAANDYYFAKRAGVPVFEMPSEAVDLGGTPRTALGWAARARYDAIGSDERAHAAIAARLLGAAKGQTYLEVDEQTRQANSGRGMVVVDTRHADPDDPTPAHSYFVVNHDGELLMVDFGNRSITEFDPVHAPAGLRDVRVIELADNGDPVHPLVEDFDAEPDSPPAKRPPRPPDGNIGRLPDEPANFRHTSESARDDGPVPEPSWFAGRVREALASGEPTVEVLTEGHTRDQAQRVEKLTFPDETVLIRKYVHQTRHADAEYLASRTGAALGARVPAVHVENGVVYMEYVAGRTGLDLYTDIPVELRIPLGQAGIHASTTEGRWLGLVDLLVGNRDRLNDKNWMVHPDVGVYGIDHSQSFHDTTNSIFGKQLRKFLGQFGIRWLDSDSSDFGPIHARLAALWPEFERLGRGDWHYDMVGRLADLEELATDKVRLRLEYDLARAQAHEEGDERAHRDLDATIRRADRTWATQMQITADQQAAAVKAARRGRQLGVPLGPLHRPNNPLEGAHDPGDAACGLLAGQAANDYYYGVRRGERVFDMPAVALDADGLPWAALPWQVGGHLEFFGHGAAGHEAVADRLLGASASASARYVSESTRLTNSGRGMLLVDTRRADGSPTPAHSYFVVNHDGELLLFDYGGRFIGEFDPEMPLPGLRYTHGVELDASGNPVRPIVTVLDTELPAPTPGEPRGRQLGDVGRLPEPEDAARQSISSHDTEGPPSSRAVGRLPESEELKRTRTGVPDESRGNNSDVADEPDSSLRQGHSELETSGRHRDPGSGADAEELSRTAAASWEEMDPTVPDGDRSAGPPRYPSPDDAARAEFWDRIGRVDPAALSYEAIADAVYQRVPTDEITGLYEGRVSGFKTGEVLRAQLHVAATLDNAWFVSADIANLRGLNNACADRAEANAHYFALAAMFRTAFEKSGAVVVPMRVGGDEMAAVVVGNIDHGIIASAVATLDAQVREYARQHHLSDLPHPKHPGQPEYNGVGLHIGYTEILPGLAVRDIFDAADLGVDRSKSRRTDVAGEPGRAAGADGTDSGAAAAAHRGAGTRPRRETAGGEGEVAGRAGADGAPGYPLSGHARYPQPEEVKHTRFMSEVARIGYADPTAFVALHEPLRKDEVTHFYEGHGSGFVTGELARARRWVADTGESGFFVSAHLINLSGLNQYAQNRSEVANGHYRAVAEIFRSVFEATGAMVVPMRTGGDRIAAVVVGTIEVAAMDAAIAAIDSRIGAYTRHEALADIANPSNPEQPGVHLRLGYVDIAAHDGIGDIMVAAERRVVGHDDPPAGTVAPRPPSRSMPGPRDIGDDGEPEVRQGPTIAGEDPTMIDTADGGRTGDSAYSRRLPDGRQMWMVSDRFAMGLRRPSDEAVQLFQEILAAEQAGDPSAQQLRAEAARRIPDDGHRAFAERYVGNARRTAALAAELGIAPEELRVRMTEELTRVFSGEIVIRTRAITLQQVLVSGGFKTLFETAGRSRIGKYQLENMAQLEQAMFGFALDHPVESRPVYARARLTRGHWGREASVALEHGDVDVVLKSTVAERATACVGDPWGVKSIPSPVTDPQPESFGATPSHHGELGYFGLEGIGRHYAGERFLDNSSVEVQIHAVPGPGGSIRRVEVIDIDYVVFHRDPPGERLREMLDGAGILWLTSSEDQGRLSRQPDPPRSAAPQAAAIARDDDSARADPAVEVHVARSGAADTLSESSRTEFMVRADGPDPSDERARGRAGAVAWDWLSERLFDWPADRIDDAGLELAEHVVAALANAAEGAVLVVVEETGEPGWRHARVTVGDSSFELTEAYEFPQWLADAIAPVRHIRLHVPGEVAIAVSYRHIAQIAEALAPYGAAASQREVAQDNIDHGLRHRSTRNRARLHDFHTDVEAEYHQFRFGASVVELSIYPFRDQAFRDALRSLELTGRGDRVVALEEFTTAMVEAWRQRQQPQPQPCTVDPSSGDVGSSPDTQVSTGPARTAGRQVVAGLDQRPDALEHSDAESSSAGEASSVQSLIVVSVVPHDELTAAFRTYGNIGDGGWTGGDSTYSRRLPDGRSVWMFSDTFLGPVHSDGSRPSDVPFVSNSFVVDDHGTMFTVLGGTRDQPRALMPPRDGEFYWLGGGHVTENTLDVMFMRFSGDSRVIDTGGDFDAARLHAALTPGGGGELELRENVLVRFDTSDLSVIDASPMPSTTGIHWASWVDFDGSHTYVHGVEDLGGTKYMHVARVRGDDLRRSWEFFAGRDGHRLRWSPRETDSVRVMSGVSNEYSVTRWNGRYLLITQDTTQPFSADILAYVSDSPTGPFTSPTLLYRTPETGRFGSYGDPNAFTYNAHEHPELRRGNTLIISYNLNSTVQDVLADVTRYRPRFIAVELNDRTSTEAEQPRSASRPQADESRRRDGDDRLPRTDGALPESAPRPARRDDVAESAHRVAAEAGREPIVGDPSSLVGAFEDARERGSDLRPAATTDQSVGWRRYRMQDEVELARDLYNRPQSRAAAVAMLDRIREVNSRLFPDKTPEEIDAAFYANSKPRWGGMVLPTVSLEELRRDGNLREIMAAVFNARFRNSMTGNASGTTFSEGIARLLNQAGWERHAAELGLDVATLGALRDAISTARPGRPIIAAVVNDEGNLGRSRAADSRLLHEYEQSRVARRDRTPEEKRRKNLTVQDWDLLGMPLSRRELEAIPGELEVLRIDTLDAGHELPRDTNGRVDTDALEVRIRSEDSSVEYALPIYTYDQRGQRIRDDDGFCLVDRVEVFRRAGTIEPADAPLLDPRHYAVPLPWEPGAIYVDFHPDSEYFQNIAVERGIPVTAALSGSAARMMHTFWLLQPVDVSERDYIAAVMAFLIPHHHSLFETVQGMRLVGFPVVSESVAADRGAEGFYRAVDDAVRRRNECLTHMARTVWALGNDGGRMPRSGEKDWRALEAAINARLTRTELQPGARDPLVSVVEAVRTGRDGADTAVVVVDDGHKSHGYVITKVDETIFVSDTLIESSIDVPRIRAYENGSNSWIPPYRHVEDAFVAYLADDDGALTARHTQITIRSDRDLPRHDIEGPPASRGHRDDNHRMAVEPGRFVQWWRNRAATDGPHQSLAQYAEMHSLTWTQLHRWLAEAGIADAPVDAGAQVPRPARRAADWARRLRDYLALTPHEMDALTDAQPGTWINVENDDQPLSTGQLRALLRRVPDAREHYSILADTFAPQLVDSDRRARYPEAYPHIGAYFRYLRTAQGLTLRQLAERMPGVAHSAISAHESDRRSPTRHLVDRYVHALQIDDVRSSELAECFPHLPHDPPRYPDPRAAESVREYGELFQRVNHLGSDEAARIMGISDRTWKELAAGRFHPSELFVLGLYDRVLHRAGPWNQIARAWGYRYRMDPTGETAPTPLRYQTIGDWVRDSRWHRRLTRRELAALMDRSHQSLANVENGSKGVTRSFLAEFGHALGMTSETVEAARSHFDVYRDYRRADTDPHDSLAFPDFRAVGSFGDYIRALREENGLTQAEVSRLTGLAPSTLRHAETGTRLRELELLHAYDHFLYQGGSWNGLAETWGYRYRMDPAGESTPNPEWYASIHDWARAHRLRSRLTAVDLAALIGRSQRGVEFVESGGRPSAAFLWDLADGLGIPDSALRAAVGHFYGHEYSLGARSRLSESERFVQWCRTRASTAGPHQSLAQYAEMHRLTATQLDRWLVDAGVDTAPLDTGAPVPHPTGPDDAPAWARRLRDYLAVTPRDMDTLTNAQPGTWIRIENADQLYDPSRRREFVRQLRTLMRRIPDARDHYRTLADTIAPELVDYDNRPRYPEGYPHIGAYFRYLRTAGGLTLKQLGEQVSLSLEAVSQREADEIRLSKEVIRDYLRVLAPDDVTYVELAEGSAHHPRTPLRFPAFHTTDSFGEYLAYLVRLNNLGNSDAARLIGVTDQSVRNIARRRHQVGELFLLRVYDRFLHRIGPWNEIAEAWGYRYRMDPAGETPPIATRFDSMQSWLHAYRMYHRMPQRAVADLTGWSIPTVSKVEAGATVAIGYMRAFRTALDLPSGSAREALLHFGAARDGRPEDALFWDLIDTDPGSPQEAAVRDRIFAEHGWIAAIAARRWRGFGESTDELEQRFRVAIDRAILHHIPGVAPFFSHAWGSCHGAALKAYYEARFPGLNALTLNLVSKVNGHISRHIRDNSPVPDQPTIAETLGLSLEQVSTALLIIEGRVVAIDPTPEDGGPALDPAAPTDIAAGTTFDLNLRAALAGFPDPALAERLVRLHLIDGVPIAEAAAELRLAPSEAVDLLASAVPRLRAAFDDRTHTD
ncbi:helix-turn-helix domain-containing protein [Nocardia sp. NPDC049220]|uniref:helix-turn-helix domain-containing protein n=1 Tax=Nocardia sp. NPDC049220 TaxID=3155273 RepID=UPI0033F82E83